MRDLEKELNDPYGEKTPLNMTAGQQMARSIRESHCQRPTANAMNQSSGVAWAFTMLILPYLALLVVMFYLIQLLANYADPYHRILSAVLPSAWFNSSGGGEARPWAVASVVGVIVVALIAATLILRRRIGNSWASGTHGAGALWLMQLPMSIIVVLLMASGPGLFLAAGAVADAETLPPLTGAAIATWPITLTILTAIWWSIGTTRRAVRRATRYRYRNWWQAPDGEWYPPDYQWMPHPPQSPYPPRQ